MATVNIKSVSSRSYSHSYKPVTVASLELGEAVPIRVIECLNGDNFTQIAGKGFLRIAPTVFPAYGRSMLKTAAFFVPEYQLTEQSEAFHSDMPSFKGKNVVIPRFAAYMINEMFYDHSGSTPASLATVEATGTNGPLTGSNLPSHFDLVYVKQGNGGTYTFEYLALTRMGKRFYKLLKSLGYDFASYQWSSGYTYSQCYLSAAYLVNALPLLAYAKIYVDMFLNSHMYNSDTLVSLLHSIHDVEDVSNYYYASTGNLASATLYLILQRLVVPHEHNMYLDAWNSPNEPLGLSPSIFSSNPDGLVSPVLPDPTGFGHGATQFHADSKASIVSTPSSTLTMGNFSQFALNMLESFYRYVKRNNLFGSKAVQRVFARFGIKSDDYNSHYVHKLYEGQSDIDFSAVVSNSDTYNSGSGTGKTLGAYSGFGVSGLNFNFKYKASEFGYIIVMSWIQVVPLLRRGFDPIVLRRYPFDFFTPEYDGKTVRAIPQCEVSVNPYSNDNPSYNGDQVPFGFTDLYDDYRTMRDSIVGDFVTDSNVKDFLFCRDLSEFRFGSYANVALKPQTTSVQYFNLLGNDPDMSNPFQLSSDNGNRFYLQVNFDIKARRNIMSKSDALDLNGSGDLQMPLGGSLVS